MFQGEHLLPGVKFPAHADQMELRTRLTQSATTLSDSLAARQAGGIAAPSA